MAAFPQSGQKFASGGNNLGNGEFLGTLNAYPLVFKINNVQRMTLTTSGFLGIGTGTPVVMLDVAGDGRVNNFNVQVNQTIGGSLSVKNIFSPLGIVDFGGSQIKTTSEITGKSILLTGPNSHISSNTGTVDFGESNLNTTATINGSKVNTTSDINVGGTLNASKIISSNGIIDFDGNSLLTTKSITGRTLLLTGTSNHITSTSGSVSFDGNSIITTSTITGANLVATTDVYIGGLLKVAKIISTNGTVDFDGNSLVTTKSITGKSLLLTGSNNHITSSTGTVDFDGNHISTKETVYCKKISLSGEQIISTQGKIDFGGNTVMTTSQYQGGGLYITGTGSLNSLNVMQNANINGNLTTWGMLTANSFQNPQFAGTVAGLLTSDANGSFQKLDFNGSQSNFLRGDGTFGPMPEFTLGDTIQASVIIGDYINSVKSVQIEGSVTAGERGAGDIGKYSIAVGGPEPAFGFQSGPVASGKYSASFGAGNVSSNFGSMSFGVGNVASGIYSVSFGGNNNCSDTLSFAFGAGNNCSEMMSVAIGNGNTISGRNAIVMGKNNTVAANQAAAIGGNINNISVDAKNSAIIGGSGITATQANTVYMPNIMSTGNVGIGVESPIEKLDVDGNANIRGYLYVQDGVIIGRRIDGQKVTSDTMNTKEIFVENKVAAKAFEARTVSAEKLTTDTLNIEKITLLEMQADSITAVKMTLDKLAINEIKATAEIGSKDLKIDETAKFGSNIVIDGTSNSISTPGTITAGNISLNGSNSNITTPGSVFAESLNAGDNLRITGSSASIESATGSLDFVNTNLNTTGDITAGVLNVQKLNVDSSTSTAIYTNRVMPLPGDSLIHLGNNSITVNNNNNTISFDNAIDASIQGLRIGNNGGVARGSNSIAIGNNIYTNSLADNAIIIGSSNATGFQNYKSNSLMVGFNTSKATLFVGPTVEGEETGNVGIGTSDPDPNAKLEVKGKVKITGGTLGNGRVLTSDDYGLASWQDPIVYLPGTGLSLSGNTLNSIWTTNSDGNHYLNTWGYVGINVNDPTEMLDVFGNAKIRGTLFVQDGVIVGNDLITSGHGYNYISIDGPNSKVISSSNEIEFENTEITATGVNALYVSAESITTDNYSIASLNGTGSGILTHNNSGLVQSISFPGTSGKMLLGDGTFGDVPSSLWNTYNNNDIFFNNTGNVGIGTDNPQNKLHIKSSEPGGSGVEFEGVTLRVEHDVVALEKKSIWDLRPTVVNDPSLGIYTKFGIGVPDRPELLTITDIGQVGINTEHSELYGFFQVSKGIRKVVIGDGFNISGSHWPTSYLGFNAGLRIDGGGDAQWKFHTDGTNNGGSMILNTINGDLRFICVPTSATVTEDQIIPRDQLIPYTKLIVNNNGVGINITNGAISWTPTEQLEVNGGIKIGQASASAGVGTIEFTGDKFRANTGSGMKPFGSKWNDGETTGDIFYSGGNVGIGTSNPQCTFEVNGTISNGGSDFVLGKLDNRDSKLKTGNRALVHDGWEWGKDNLVINYDGDFEDGVQIMGPKTIFDGKVGINNNNPTYMLDIIGEINSNGLYITNDATGEVDVQILKNGHIFAREIDINLTTWQDKVFHSDYSLLPLYEVEKFILQNKHLPDIPSEKDVLENGISLGEMNSLLLKKIEELTLYIIDLKKEVDTLKINK